jgi:hypothetical protein
MCPPKISFTHFLSRVQKVARLWCKRIVAWQKKMSYKTVWSLQNTQPLDLDSNPEPLKNKVKFQVTNWLDLVMHDLRPVQTANGPSFCKYNSSRNADLLTLQQQRNYGLQLIKRNCTEPSANSQTIVVGCTSKQWRTQEFFRGGGGQQIQLRTEGRQNKSGGGSPLVRGSTQFAYEWNPYSY